MKARFSGAYEILAKSFHGEGQVQIAVTVLQNGVKEAPGVWLLWMQLGNYYSELGDLESAVEAYGQARQIQGSDVHQLDFNEAFLRLSFGNIERALEMLDNVIKNSPDKELGLVALTHRLSTLIELDRIPEALLELGEAYLHDKDNAELLSTLADKLLQKGDKINALNLAKQALGLNRAGPVARVVRLIEGLHSERASLFEVQLQGTLEQEADSKSFRKTSKVYADSENDAINMAISFEPADVRSTLQATSVTILSQETKTETGVDWSSEIEILTATP